MADPAGARSTPDTRDAWVFATLPRAVAYAAALLRDGSSADDVVHDCYCRLLEKADVYDLPHDGTRLLFRAITNACIDLRDRARKTLTLDTPERLTDRGTVEPIDGLIGRELQAALDVALDALPVAQRAALELKSLGHSLQAIADALGVSATNAGVLVHRARRAVAERLGTEGYD